MSKYNLRLKWLSVASYELERDGHTVLTDPFITVAENTPCTWESVEHCDLMTLSHVHWDHITDIPAISDKFDHPPILCGELSALPLCEWGNLYPQQVFPMESNLELDFDWIKVKALFGRHVAFDATCNELRSRLSRKPFVDKAMGDMQILGTLEYRNFFFTYPDGLKVLVWGNDLSVTQRNILKALKPDVAIMQATRQIKDPKAFAEFVAAVGPKVVVPHHMDLAKPYAEYLPAMEEVRKEMAVVCPETEFVLPPDHGVWFEV